MPANLTGIYQITNIVNGKRYIGSTLNMMVRKQMHLWKLKNHKHVNAHLQSAFVRYGEGAFTFSPLLICDGKNLMFFEQRFIGGYKPEYNLSSRVGYPIPPGSHLTAIHRTRIGEANRGKKLSPEHIEMIRQVHLGIKLTQEHREKLSGALLGRKLSPEHRQRIGEAKMGEKNPQFGKHLTPEHRRKISEGMMGEKNYFFGKHHSPDTCNKISQSMIGDKHHNFGKHLSPEVRKKIGVGIHEACMRRNIGIIK